MTLPEPSRTDDPLRLAALQGYGILDTVPEEGFDDLAHLAARACAVPVALVSLVDHDRQWFKPHRLEFRGSYQGLTLTVTAFPRVPGQRCVTRPLGS